MNRVSRESINYVSKSTRHAQLQQKIASLCRLRKLKEALQILELEAIPSLSSLYSPILQLCTDLKAEKEGRLVHYRVLRNGFNSDLNICTKLIIFYAKVGDVDNARRVFDTMPDRNIVSWTALLSGYSRYGYSKEALEIFSLMHRAGVRANQFTYGSVLRSCTSLMSLERGKQIQGCIVKSRFWEDLFVQSALVDMHSKCGVMEDARYLFDGMSQRDVVSWNAMIGGYATQLLVDDCLTMFYLMLNEGMTPDQFTFGSVLRVCASARLLMMVNQIHSFIIQLGFQSYNVLNGSLIDAYVKCRSLRSAKLVYDLMQVKDLVSCTALITGYAREGNYSQDAFNLFCEINRMDMGMDDVVLCSMLNVSANSASLSLGRQIHALALKRRPNYDVALGNALIDMYAKSGEIENANCAFDEMQEKNVISWTSLITGYGKHGYGEKAIILFEKMEDNGLKPNDVTFLSILFACSHTGMVKKGWDCFNSMITRYNTKPRSEHYSCMIDLFARSGQLEQAYNLLYKMNFKINSSLWGALLGACRTYGNISLAKLTASHFFHLDPENPVNYVVLANIYSAAGLWEEACKTRKLMEERGVKKEPGCSFIQYSKSRYHYLLEER